MKSVVTKEDGFGFSATVIMVSFILGFSILYLSNSVSLNISEVADDYSASQSYWSALSGIEYTIQKAWETESSVSAIGTYSFYNSTVTVQISNVDRFGNPLPSDNVRVVCTGIHGQTKRILEVTAEEVLAGEGAKAFWPDESTIETDEGGKLVMKDSFILNDTIYVGADVEAGEGNPTIGDTQYGDPTLIRVAPGKTVTGYNPWVEHDSAQFLPVVDFSNEDSLITVAQGITQTSGNKINGDLIVDNGTLDLNTYQDRTLFVKGVVQLRGSSVIGGSYSIPGILVATGDIIAMELGGTETTVEDDIIFISNTLVKISNQTQFGTSVTQTVNEIYSPTDVKVEGSSTVWAQLFSVGNMKLEGNCYGLMFAEGGLEWTQETAYIEGAIFTGWISGSTLSVGRWNLTHEFPDWYLNPNPPATDYSFDPVGGTLREI